MNSFIVWDNVSKSFRNDFKDFIGINIKGQLYSFKHKIEMNEEYSIYWDIELKDINGKSIYADSSIVEFNNSQLWNKYNGIFFYNKEKLCYQIRIVDGVRNNEIIPYDIYCSDFKIIDTIQENKLGLIKGL